MHVTFQQSYAARRRTTGGIFACNMPCVPRVGDEVSMPNIFGYVTKVEWNWGAFKEYQPAAWVYVKRYPNDKIPDRWR